MSQAVKDRPEDRHLSLALTVFANTHAESKGWRVWVWREDERRADVVCVADPIGRMVDVQVTDEQRRHARPLEPEVAAVARLVEELGAGQSPNS